MIVQRYTQLSMLHSVNTQTMSILFTALDTQEKKRVVLKFFKGNPINIRQDLKLRQMFDREILIAQSLNHEYILRAIDSGVTTLIDVRASWDVAPYEPLPDIDYLSGMQDMNDLPFLVYPYMPDGSLSDFIQKNSPWEHWTLLQTGDVILQAASALQYMHTRSQPLVHWDVKPPNFLVQKKGELGRIVHLYLCDFGISRIQKQKTEETSTAYGTYSYMAPEQFNRKVRCESDQYALAMMACYLLTGRYPLENKTRDQYLWASIHQNDVPLKPSFLNPRRVQSAQIDYIITRALKKTPEERFPTIWAFAKNLYDAIKQQEHASYAITVAVQPPAVMPTPNFAPMPLHPPIDTSEYQIKVEVPDLVVQKPVAAQNIWNALSYTSMKKVLEYDVPATPHMLSWSSQEDKLGCFFLEHAPLLAYHDGSVAPIEHIKTGYTACWAAYGEILAVSSLQKKRGTEESVITIVNLDEAKATSFTPSTQIINGFDWSVDGQLAIWPESESLIHIYTLPPHALRQSIPKSQNIFTGNMLCEGGGALRWSPNGLLLAAGSIDGTIKCWQKETHTLYWPFADFRMPVYSLAWSRNGKFLAVAFKDRKVVVLDVEQKRVKVIWKNLPLVPLNLSFSANDLLTISSTKKYLLLGSVDDATPTMKQHGQLLGTWSPTGTKLATLDAENTKKVVIWQIQ